MGLSVGNLAVKTKERNSVVKHVRSYKEFEFPQLSFYISNTLGGYVCVFPSSEFRQARKLAGYLSQELNALAFAGCVYDSDSLDFSVYEDGTRCVLYKKEDVSDPLLRGDINQFLEKFPLVNDYSSSDLRKVFVDSYTFEEDRYEDLLELFGLPAILRGWGYRYLRREEEEGRFDLLVEDGIFPKGN